MEVDDDSVILRESGTAADGCRKETRSGMPLVSTTSGISAGAPEEDDDDDDDEEEEDHLKSDCAVVGQRDSVDHRVPLTTSGRRPASGRGTKACAGAVAHRNTRASKRVIMMQCCRSIYAREVGLALGGG